MNFHISSVAVLFTYQMQLCGNGSFTTAFLVKTEASAMEKGGPAKTKGIHGSGFNCNIILSFYREILL